MAEGQGTPAEDRSPNLEAVYGAGRARPQRRQVVFSRSHSEQVGESQNCTAFKSATSHFAVPTTGSAGRTEG